MTNIADIFTKEDKDKDHFLKMRDCIVCDPIFLKDDDDAQSTDIDLTHFSMDRGVLAHNPLSQSNTLTNHNP